jgi:large subunit ribosomal protein L27
MAHKKAGSSSKNGRDSVGQRLGVKAGDGQLVQAGTIIVRQRGMTFVAGNGAGLGHDYTVFATVAGHVRFDHATRDKKRVRVISADAVEPAIVAPSKASASARTPANASASAPKATAPAKAAVHAKAAGSAGTAVATATAPTEAAPARRSRTKPQENAEPGSPDGTGEPG